MFPFCEPENTSKQVKKVIEKLSFLKEELMIFSSIFGKNIPLENIETFCEVEIIEKYCLKVNK